MSNPHKYYKTMGELIDHYVPFDDNEPYVQALIHAYELAEYDSKWEQENN